MNAVLTVILGPTVEQMKTTIILNYSYTPKHLSLLEFFYFSLSPLLPILHKIADIFLKSHLQYLILLIFKFDISRDLEAAENPKTNKVNEPLD